ncbi:MAG: hypothetical protein ACREP9_15820 [Candidatus Dormibacteraceae bacterium]
MASRTEPPWITVMRGMPQVFVVLLCCICWRITEVASMAFLDRFLTFDRLRHGGFGFRVELSLSFFSHETSY